MEYKDIPKDELKLVSEKMIGLVLLGAEKDSNGDFILPSHYYKVEQHKPSGKLIIFPCGVNMQDEFMNYQLEKSGKLN